MSNLVPPPNVDGRAYRHYRWKVMARHSYGLDHSDPPSGASVDSNDSGVVCDLPSSLNSSKVSSFEETQKDGQDLYTLPSHETSELDNLNKSAFGSNTNCDTSSFSQQQQTRESLNYADNLIDQNDKQLTSNQVGQDGQVPANKRIPPGWSCGVYGSGYENLVVGHFMPPIRPGSASSYGSQARDRKPVTVGAQNMLLDYLSSPGSSNLTSDLSSPSYAERSPCSVDYLTSHHDQQTRHRTKDLSPLRDDYHRPSQVTFDPLILENVLSPMNESCQEDIFESLIPPDLYSSVSEILDSEDLHLSQQSESKELKELGVKEEDDRPPSSSWNRYSVLPPVLTAPAPTPVDFNPPREVNMAPSAMSGYSAPLPMFSAAFADSVCSSSFASPRQSTRSSYSGRGSRNKRALSISPLSADGIDINSLIRMSPTSLLPMSGSGSLTSLSPGCYGHLSARNSSSSPSNASSHRLSVSTNGGASTTTGIGGRHASIKDDFIDLDSNIALYQAMQSLESSIAMQDVLQVSHNQAVLPHNSLQQFEQDLMNRLSDPSAEPHTGSEPPMTAAALPTPTALASLRPSCIPPLNRPPPSYDQHMARKHFLVQKKSSSDSSQPSNYSSFDSSEGDRTGEVNDDPSGIRQYICWWIDCGNTFPDQEELVRHLEKTHVDQRKGEEYTCFWQGCQRRLRPFNARYKLLIHMRVHSGEKPNKCSFDGCTKAFSRLENLKIHLRSHTGERPYACQFPSCTKAFSNSSDRAKHQRTHQDTKPYACQIPGCTKRYTDPSSLRKHVKNHTTKTDQAKKKLRGDLNEPVDTDLLSKCLTIQAIRPNHPILQQGDREDSYATHDFIMTHDSGLGRSPAHNSQHSNFNSGGYYSNGMSFSNTMSPGSHQSSPQTLRDIAESNEPVDTLISILQDTNQSKLSLPPISQSNRRSPSIKPLENSRSASSRSNIGQLPPLNRNPVSPGLPWSPGTNLTFPTFQDSFSNKYGIILEDYARPGGVS